jgi:hypothetical protein
MLDPIAGTRAIGARAVALERLQCREFGEAAPVPGGGERVWQPMSFCQLKT